MSQEKLQGQCLCGEVKLVTETAANTIEACHCDMCRKWGGGPLLAIECGSEVVIEGEQNIGVFNSSEWAERAFCQQCGTHLYYRIKQANHYVVPVGLFDNVGEMELVKEIFIDQKPTYYCFANDTKKMTGAEVFAQYAPAK